MLMMTKQPAFSGVAAGQTANCRINRGWTYHQFLLNYSGVTLAQMTEIRLIVNGDIYRRWTGADVLDLFNQYDGLGAASGTLVLECRRRGLKNRVNQDITAIGTGMPVTSENPIQANTITLEVDIDAAAASPALTLYSRHTGPSNTGNILQLRRKIYNAAGAGTFEINDLHQKGDVINRIFFMTNAITELTVERNNTVIYNRTEPQNDLIQDDGVRNSQASMFVLDTTEEGHGLDLIQTAGAYELRFLLEMSAGATIPIYLETIGPLKK